MALASLRAQTIDDWECVIVDDGSPCDAATVVRRFGDPRFRIHTFRTNRGRPVARQKALEMARGDYICMLDADDWYYPDKLRSQLQLLEQYPRAAAVGCGVAVIDDDNRITGVRRSGGEEVQLNTGQRFRVPSLLFPTTMFRREVARDAEFDPRLQRAEDPDYLCNALAGRHYLVSPRLHYAYREIFSARALEEALIAFRCQRITFRDQLRAAPARSALKYLENLIKTGVYRLALATGRGRWLFERRNARATLRQRRMFRDHRQQVRSKLPSELTAP